MNHCVHLCLVLHNHQPIGNFEGVFQQAYESSYRPFLDVLEEYPSLRLSLHTSGPLMRWFEQAHPEYVQRLVNLVVSGNLEILGGPIYEPILTMLPSRDRVGQILAYSDYLGDLMQTQIRGMWMPERVWESVLASDLARSGIQYTVLDDYHFVAAGWPMDDLHGYYLTEEDGHLVRVFPGSEKLRYLIPFAEVDRTIQFLQQTGQEHPGAVLVFADDGEKFGTWPETYSHVYERGWLRRFFDALMENGDWLKTCTLSDVVDTQAPRGKIYLPECSYREMTEWALPTAAQYQFQAAVHQYQQQPGWHQDKQWLRAGNWRNFKAKYSEANEMYSRMLQVSRKLHLASSRTGDAAMLSQAEDHLYRGQCNCPYWHGAFGGIYLPHLRDAIYSELIAADNILDKLEHGHGAWIESTCDDYNLDTCNEVRLANDQLVVWVAPNSGGMIYELDVREARHNLLATMQRRPEVYHAKIAEHASGHYQSDQHTTVESIHDRVVFKQAGLEQHLQYDLYPRKSFLEHFYDNDLGLDRLLHGSAMERGDFVGSAFEAKLRRAANKIQVQLSREGNAWGIPLKITKALTLQAGSCQLDIAYLIEGLPQDRQLHLALEWNFAGLPVGAEDRYFYTESQGKLATLGTPLDLCELQQIGIRDQWRKLDIGLRFNRPTRLWTHSLGTVSQSEGGFEMVHQSLCVLPHWIIQGDRDGTWSLQMQINIESGNSPKLLVPASLNVPMNQSVSLEGWI